jgi:competence protein ComEA
MQLTAKGLGSGVPPQGKIRARVGLGAVVVLLLAALVVGIVVSGLSPHGANRIVAAAASNPAVAPTSGTIFVHVIGAVENPGLYKLRDGDRAVDAVGAAGGFSQSADQSQLNLARLVSDGEQLVVPEIGEVPAAAAGTTAGKVNINVADAPTLETLPRVGPAMAERIIAWRTANGRFSAIEDLMSVTGIGPKTFDGFKDLITI